MDPIVNNIPSWFMKKRSNDSDVKIHPSSDFFVWMQFDENVFMNNNTGLTDLIQQLCNMTAQRLQMATFELIRLEHFSRDTTLKDLKDRIQSGYCYGYYQGLRMASNKELEEIMCYAQSHEAFNPEYPIYVLDYSK
jgi:hypothetical protein